MIIAGIVLLSIAGLILLIFIGYVISYACSGGNTFGVLASVGIKVYLPIFLVFLACAIAGVLMIVLNV